jgi:hypothetical protein
MDTSHGPGRSPSTCSIAAPTSARSRGSPVFCISIETAISLIFMQSQDSDNADACLCRWSSHFALPHIRADRTFQQILFRTHAVAPKVGWGKELVLAFGAAGHRWNFVLVPQNDDEAGALCPYKKQSGTVSEATPHIRKARENETGPTSDPTSR